MNGQREWTSLLRQFDRLSLATLLRPFGMQRASVALFPAERRIVASILSPPDSLAFEDFGAPVIDAYREELGRVLRPSPQA